MIPPLILPVDALLLLGPTGAGKSPLGNALERSGCLGRRVHHLDFGEELRTAAGARSPAFSREETAFITGVLERGLLLENEHFVLARKIITRFLERRGFTADDLLVLNGIPRHAGQAADIAQIASIRAIVMLECSVKDVHCRIQGNTGGDRTDRTDDAEHQIENKIRIFQERTAPLLQHYEQTGCRVYRLRITATTSPAEAAQQLTLLSSAHPPITFVAEPPQ